MLFFPLVLILCNFSHRFTDSFFFLITHQSQASINLYILGARCTCTQQHACQRYFTTREKVLSMDRRLNSCVTQHIPKHVDIESRVWWIRSRHSASKVFLITSSFVYINYIIYGIIVNKKSYCLFSSILYSRGTRSSFQSMWISIEKPDIKSDCNDINLFIL